MRPLVIVTLALASVLLGTPVAHAQDWRVPKSATITVRGHGYGHGHGMSQYGAEGAARAGLDHREIAEFYYPGTRWGKARGRIEVLLTADTTDDLVVRKTSGLRVTDLGTGESLTLPDKSTTRWRTTVARDGRTLVSWLRGTRWRPWRKLAGHGAFSVSGGTVTLVSPAGERAYRGRLAALPPSAGSRDRVTVNSVGLEAYLRGVVPLEMPALWHPEAVRAQSIAARTYAAYERAHPRGSAFDVYDTTASQVYGGVAAEHPASDAAIRATRRRILRHGKGPAFTQFSSSNGGWTVAGAVPYQVAKADPYDGWSGNPNHDWAVTVDDRRIEGAWPALGNLRRIEVTARDGNGQWGGRVRSLRLVGSKRTVTVSGDTFRWTLGLKSTWFTFRVR
ncbi:SpoIID/LytB domain-containing protein [Nocardioides coralli]|uniref:SpoIID/LytB domain-containing protein n=1 Tax=Nocardioides coralli TaxID=2872154 RepID=UPI001CA44067|nr:SpoIID/LytB domain-containing protein [Nocardioides coralli]QZY29949.1 SpoIID/LytB domain-containing protein [Nocardioides coralli]